MEESIRTSEAKAKAIKGAADKLVTKAKKGGPDALRDLAPDVRYDAVAKLVNTIAPRFADRQGGYTRIIKVGRRVADNAPEVVMEWVVKGEKTVAVKNAKAKKSEKKTTVKAEAKIVKPQAAKEAKASRSAAPKKMVTRQKKG